MWLIHCLDKLYVGTMTIWDTSDKYEVSLFIGNLYKKERMITLPYKVDRKLISGMESLIRSSDLRIIIDGVHGTFSNRFREFEDIGNIVTDNFETDILHYKYFMSFKKLKYHEKLEVKIAGEFIGSIQRDILKRLYPEDVPSNLVPDLIPDMVMLSNRFKLLLGIAVLINSPGGRLRVFRHNQKTSNRIYQLHFNGISPFTDHWFERTEDTYENISRALNYLWFNYQVDITGKDNLVKKISLEEMYK